MTDITTTTVTGRVSLPDNVTATGGAVEFLLNAYDTEAGADVTVAPDVISAPWDASGDISVTLWPNSEGTRSTRYRVTIVLPNNAGAKRIDCGYITVPDAGPVDLNDLLGASVVVTPDNLIYTPAEFGDTAGDSTNAINAMFTYCVPRKIKMLVAGDHNCSGTISPGGAYHCEWVQARLFYTGSTPATDLTEVQYNPDGSTEPEGSGKYVFFDTAGCEKAVNIGSVEIIGATISNSTQASLATIPANTVAVTASAGISPTITWGSLIIRGWDRGLWQGDQRGSGTNILPMTRWVGDYLEIKHCNIAIEDGQSGNGLDEFYFSSWHLTRNNDNGLIRTSVNGGPILIKGKRMPADGDTNRLDAEAFKATTTAGGTTVTFDGAHGLIVGDKIAINGASENLDDPPDALIHVSRVDVVTDNTTVEIETAAFKAVSGAGVIVNPPSFMLEGKANFQRVYGEEVHDICIGIGTNGYLATPDLQFSNGDFGSRANMGFAFTGSAGMGCDVTINRVSNFNNTNIRYLAGVPGYMSGTNAAAIDAHIEMHGYTPNQFNKSQPFGVYRPEDDILGSFTRAAGAPSVRSQTLKASFAGQVRYYQAGSIGDAQIIRSDVPYEEMTYGTNLRSNDDLTGVSTDGADIALAGGVITKDAGVECFLWEAITVTANERLRISYNATVTARGITVMLFNTPGGAPNTPAGNIVNTGIPIRTTSEDYIFLDVPANTAKIGIRFDDTSAGTIDKFIVQKQVEV
jgi:hypothetical protein